MTKISNHVKEDINKTAYPKCCLSVVVPCYNEENYLERCLDHLMQIKDESLELQVIIVDDASQDNSLEIANKVASRSNEITVLKHDKNLGKGAALQTGFTHATGDFIAIQDADLEYDPCDLKRMLIPLRNNKADVVFGSRFLSGGVHRVLYFWHYMANKLLTLLSNMFTDLNLTDMETCYKVFRREIVQRIELNEKRFGIEPELVAKVAQLRPRIYEMGISYHGRTYEEGKKIGLKDAFRALYCILRYNAHKAPIPIQFIFYLFIGGIAAVSNLLLFFAFINTNISVNFAAPAAFLVAAIVNYILCVLVLFRHKAQWKTIPEIGMYFLVVIIVAWFDLAVTKVLISFSWSYLSAKSVATMSALTFNFIGRRYFVFKESVVNDW